MSEQFIGIIELPDGINYVIKRDKYLIAGGMTNAGLIEEHKMKIDPYFSIDENLQAFVEKMEVNNEI